jgi:hypothetical protein
MDAVLSLPVLTIVLLVVLVAIFFLSKSVAREEQKLRKPLKDVQTPAEQREDLRIIDKPLGAPMANTDRSLLDDWGVRDLRD